MSSTYATYRLEAKKKDKKGTVVHGFFSAQVFKTACEFWNPEQFHEFPEIILKWATMIRTVVFPRISNLHNIIKIDVCGPRRSLALKPKRFLSPATSKPWGFSAITTGLFGMMNHQKWLRLVHEFISPPQSQSTFLAIFGKIRNVWVTARILEASIGSISSASYFLVFHGILYNPMEFKSEPHALQQNLTTWT